MKNKKAFKCFIVIVLVVITLFTACSNTFAQINSEYGENSSVKEENLDKKMIQSVILDAASSLVYAVASWVENIIGMLFESLTGDNMFPWADRVIFNTVPLLDVNFLNPSSGSMFLTAGSNETALSIIVRRTYYTIFSLAVAFLGILVAVMAVKLATTTIAAKKGQYKEAITKWLFTIVLLFVMHYAMALIFYINEQMVTIASNMLTDSLKDVTLPNDLLEAKTDEEKKDNVEIFLDAQTQFSVPLDIGWNMTNGLSNIWGFLTGIDAEISKGYIRENYLYADQLISNRDYQEIMIPGAKTSYGTVSGILGDPNSAKQALSTVYLSIKIINDPNQINLIREELKNYNTNNITDEQRRKFVSEHQEKFLSIPLFGNVKKFQNTGNFAADVDLTDYNTRKNIDKAMIKFVNVHKLYVNIANGEVSKENTKGNLIAGMGEFFKETAFTYETSNSGEVIGWKASKLTLQGAILYSVFVFQSVMYLFAYAKRFFYIIVLAIFAPAVIIFDFFSKSVS